MGAGHGFLDQSQRVTMANRRLQALANIRRAWGVEGEALANRMLALVDAWQDLTRQAKRNADAMLMLGCATEEIGRLLVHRDCSRELLDYINGSLLPASVCLKRRILNTGGEEGDVLQPMARLMHLIVVPDKQFGNALLEKAMRILKLSAEHGTLPN